VAVSNVELRVNATQAVAALKKVNTGATTFNKTVNGTTGKLKVASAGATKAAAGFSLLPPALIATGAGAKVAAGGFVALQAALAPILAPLLTVTAAIGVATAAFKTLAEQDFAEAKFRTLGGNSRELVANLKSLSDELSGQASVVELTAAAYDVASAGFTDAADAAMILKAASLGATGGFTDINTSGGAAVKVLNAYGLQAKDAAFLMDQFAQTQADGIITIGQYSNNIGKVATTAAGLGVELSEVNAILAQSTAAGTNIETAFSGLNSALAKISSGQAGKKLGIELNESTLRTEGLAGALAKLEGFSTGELQEAFGIEAFKGIQVAVENTEKFNQLLENQINASGRATKSAMEAQNTIQGQMKRLSTAFVNIMAEGSEIGIVIRESLKIAAVTVEFLGLAVKQAAAPFRALAAFVNEIANAIMSELGGDAMDIVVGFEQAWIFIKNAVNENIDSIIEFGKQAGRVVAKLVKVYMGAFNAIKQFVQNDPVLSFLFGQIQKLMPKVEIDVESDDLKDLKKDLDDANDKTNQLSDAFKKVGDKIATGVSDALHDAVMGTKSLGEAARNILQGIASDLLRLGINTMLKSFGGPFASLTGFASGGRPPVGRPSIVGEKGPEIFVPSTAGTIIPNNELGGSSMTNNIVVNVDMDGGVDAQGGEQEGRELGRLIALAVQSEIIQQKRAGGLLA